MLRFNNVFQCNFIVKIVTKLSFNIKTMLWQSFDLNYFCFKTISAISMFLI